MDSAVSEPAASVRRSWTTIAAAIAITLSLILCVCVSICYALRPDTCAAITVFPVWAWLAPGLLLPAILWRRAPRRWMIGGVGCCWLIYLAVLGDEPRGLVRSIFPAPDIQAYSANGSSMIRVVTVNCSGEARAVEEAAALSPDILLVQESPAEPAFLTLAESRFGRLDGAAHGGDVAVLAQGSVQVRYASRTAFGAFIHCTVQLDDGRIVDVIGLRLSPPTVRVDLWSPACWRGQMEHRERQRNELAAALKRLNQIPPDRPVIVAGDFNAPAGDAIFALLGPRLKDAFREAGRGWGNTITNDYPFHRIDQIWTSVHLTPVDCRARPTTHSDHRMVVAELRLNPQRP